MVVEDRQHSFPGFMFVIGLDRDESQLIARENSTAELPRWKDEYFFLVMEGLSLGLEHRRTPL